MKNLFEKEVLAEAEQRINKLNPASARQWGKMNCGQMLAHCAEAFKYPNSDKPEPRMMLGRIIGWAIKKKIYDDSALIKNTPTAKNFIFTDDRNFEEEKSKLLNCIRTFNKLGPGVAGRFPHPMFGELTPQQWGQFMYKHLDHHLKQFGV